VSDQYSYNDDDDGAQAARRCHCYNCDVTMLMIRMKMNNGRHSK